MCRCGMLALAACVPWGLAGPVCDTGWYLVAMLKLAWLPTAPCKGCWQRQLNWRQPGGGYPCLYGRPPNRVLEMCNKPPNAPISRACFSADYLSLRVWAVLLCGYSAWSVVPSPLGPANCVTRRTVAWEPTAPSVWGAAGCMVASHAGLWNGTALACMASLSLHCVSVLSQRVLAWELAAPAYRKLGSITTHWLQQPRI